jgi:hypothetical protein
MAEIAADIVSRTVEVGHLALPYAKLHPVAASDPISIMSTQ